MTTTQNTPALSIAFEKQSNGDYMARVNGSYAKPRFRVTKSLSHMITTRYFTWTARQGRFIGFGSTRIEAVENAYASREHAAAK